jgi:LysM repeat protein
MKSQRMSVKRRPVRGKGFRTLFANVARTNKRKSHRAATSASPADFEGDVPNLGITRALVVILLIHVVAILGIFIHSYRIEEKPPAAAEAERPEVREMSSAAEPEGVAGPRIREDDSEYTVGSGETYGSIAERFGLDESELRVANDNLPLRQGRRLRIPPQTITAVEPPEIRALRGEPASSGAGESATASAASSPSEEAPPQAIRVEPRVEAGDWLETDAARRADGREPVSGVDANGAATYKVEPGDTFWGISQRYNTTPERLMKHNGIDDPRKLRIGMTLKIPD